MSNALARESSPYLRQHADNPVDWLPWSQQALDLAHEHNKPILLSIGYSACHWCHVMAHESFEDEATAALMNRHFINIKVDREERPDIDRIYQTAHQLIAQRPGGWPLTMFLTPGDLMPFFGGTYFPETARHGLPGFADVLQRVAEFYRRSRDDVQKQSAAMEQFFQSLDHAATEQATLGRDNRYTAPVQALYTPTETPKAERGSKLPALDNLLQWTTAMQSINDKLLETAAPRLLEHSLMQDNYLLHFLIQHYSQHYESILMILTQRACQADDGSFIVKQPLAAQAPTPNSVAVQPGHYRVGGSIPVAYDNELHDQDWTQSQ